MLDELTNPMLIERTLKNKDATETELDLAYRLRDALDEIDLLVRDVCRVDAQSAVQRGSYIDGDS